jgi:hypothetical protein
MESKPSELITVPRSRKLARRRFLGDRRQSSSAIGRGSMLTPAHHEASSP